MRSQARLVRHSKAERRSQRIGRAVQPAPKARTVGGANAPQNAKGQVERKVSVKARQMLMDFGGTDLNARPLRAVDGFAAVRPDENPAEGDRLMEAILERGNMLEALKRVEGNKGAPGVDGMGAARLRGYLDRHWDKIKSALLDGTHRPEPVRRVEIPKESGGVRLLGIPTALDRLIQQAVAQALSPLWEPTFSERSYGFRPGRSAHMAVEQARRYVEDGYTHVVDIDLSKFFDRVHHDRLMARLAGRIRDKRVLKLIRAYLDSGALVGGVVERTGEGTPQGGPLSPLLANIVLDELDKELERRGLRFVRYADDVAVYVRTPKAAERVKRSLSRFITGRLAVGQRGKSSRKAVPQQIPRFPYHAAHREDAHLHTPGQRQAVQEEGARTHGTRQGKELGDGCRRAERPAARLGGVLPPRPARNAGRDARPLGQETPAGISLDTLETSADQDQEPRGARCSPALGHGGRQHPQGRLAAQQERNGMRGTA